MTRINGLRVNSLKFFNGAKITRADVKRDLDKVMCQAYFLNLGTGKLMKLYARSPEKYVEFMRFFRIAYDSLEIEHVFPFKMSLELPSVDKMMKMDLSRPMELSDLVRIRYINRGILNVKRLCRDLEEGEFPGRYKLTPQQIT